MCECLLQAMIMHVNICTLVNKVISSYLHTGNISVNVGNPMSMDIIQDINF